MQFNYQARTKEGEAHSGVVEASSKEAALALLQKYGFYITYLEEGAKQPFFSRKIKLFDRVSKRDVVIFSRQLSIMLSSKVPPVESLRILVTQIKNRNLSEKILQIAEDVEGGTNLSKAFSVYPEIFSPLYINMIKSGEASGKLSDSLNYIADHLEKDYYLMSKIKGVMVYPAFILLVLTAVFLAIMLWIIPNIKSIFEKSEQEIPPLTKLTIAVSDLFINQGMVLLLIFIVFVGAAIAFLMSRKGKEFLSIYSLNIPLIGDFFKKIYLARFAENLSTLISGGLPIIQSLEIAGDVVGNEVYKSVILEAKKSVLKGETISSVLVRFPKIMPPLFTQMVQTGERTGRLDNVLLNVVNFYQIEIERTLESLISIIEPVLIVFLGLMVAFLAVAVLLPIYKLSMAGV